MKVLHTAAQEQARARWNGIAKPLHSLGKLEDLIVQIAGIQESAEVALKPRCALVFCADHGVVAEGVTQSGSEVTALVAQSIVEHNANINLMAAAAETEVFAVDMGMVSDVPGLIQCKIANGTRNMAHEPAMTRLEAEQAVQRGIELVGEMKKRGYRMLATGEMGIGNTTASTALACALLSLNPEELTGRGAGLSDEGLRRKRSVIQHALNMHLPDPADPMDILSKVGGFEIAGMTGAFLGGWKYRIPIVIDGVISAVAALLAVRMQPEARNFMLPSHMSREPAARLIMAELGMEPLVEADLALGEGTGAVTLFPLLDMAYAVYAGTHTFGSLGMDAYRDQGGRK